MSTISTIGEMIRHHAAERPDKAALISGDAGERVQTYSQVNEESSRVAQAMAAAGVGAQDRVAFLDRNVPEYFTMLFGAAKLNAVTVAVNWRLAPPEMAYILNHSKVKVLLIGEEFLGHLKSMDLDGDVEIVVIGEDGGEYPTFEEWIADHDAVDPMAPSAPNDTCYQLYTSGTTGLPKGVELTNSNFFDMIPVASEMWCFDADSVNLVAMPLFHIAGSGWGVVGLFNGATNIMMREIDPAAIIAMVPEYKITNALFVPAVIQFMLMMPGAAEADFSSMRRIIYGASPITEEVLVGGMQTFGCEFCQVYGLTETTGGVTQLDPEDHDPGGPRAHLLRSAGKAVPGTEIRIVDDEGNDLPDGEVGEIWIKSGQNLKAYYADDEATADAFPEGRDPETGLGWFATGDAGFLDDGFLFIHDRIKDMIVSGGENVYPAEIENVLMKHPGIADAAVIGVPHEKWGETVKAIVVRAGDEGNSDEEIIAYCRENLAHYKCPTSVDEAEVLPRNPSGKILKTELREPYWEGHERMVN